MWDMPSVPAAVTATGWKVTIALLMRFAAYFFHACSSWAAPAAGLRAGSPPNQREGCHLLRHSHPLLQHTGFSLRAKPESSQDQSKSANLMKLTERSVSGRAAFVLVTVLFHLLCAEWEWAALWWTGIWCKRSFWHICFKTTKFIIKVCHLHCYRMGRIE